MTRESAAAQTDKKLKWISGEGSSYKFSIEGDGLTVGEASLLEDETAVAQTSAVGKTKYNEKTNVSSRVDFAIKDRGVQKGAAVKITGRL